MGLVILVTIAVVFAVDNFSRDHQTTVPYHQTAVPSVEEAAAAADVNNSQGAANSADKPTQGAASERAGEQRAPSGDARPKPKRTVNGAREVRAPEAAGVSRPELAIIAPETGLTLDQASNLLTRCIKPEAQYGRYSSFEDGEVARKILQGPCNRELLDFIDTCAAGNKNSEDKCLSSAMITAQETVAGFGK